MKKDAERMDPTVKRPGSATTRSVFGDVVETPVAKRTRGPNKVKTAVVDGAQ
jgi:hypothetical protein